MERIAEAQAFNPGPAKSRPIVLSGFNYANEMARRRITAQRYTWISWILLQDIRIYQSHLSLEKNLYISPTVIDMHVDKFLKFKF